MRIESIQEYLKDEKKFNEIFNEIYRLTKHLNSTYKNYEEWYFGKNKKRCKSYKGNILFYKNEKNEIVGISILKKSEEKKLCTIYVKEEYRKKGIGKKLLEKSFKYLETQNPFFTLPENNLEMFKSLIEKYNWKITINNKEIYVNNNLST